KPNGSLLIRICFTRTFGSKPCPALAKGAILVLIKHASRTKAAHEADALLNLRNTRLPMVFVFDGNVALEVLALKFFEDAFDITSALPVRHIGRRGSIVALILQVTADDPALEHPHAVDRT